MPRARTKSVANVGDAIGLIQADLRTLRDDIAQLTQHMESASKDAGGAAMGDVKARLSRAKSTVDELLAKAGLPEIDATRAVNVVDGVVDDVEETVRAHPLMAITAAVGFGFIIASLRR